MKRLLNSSPAAAALIIAIAGVIVAPAMVRAEGVTAGPATFDLPAGLESVSGRPAAVIASWRSTREPITIDVVEVPVPGDKVGEAVNEFADWPGIGRSMIAGFGKGSVRALGQALGASCSYSGVPVSRDAGRVALRVTVDTTCATKPEPSAFRSWVIVTITRSGQLIVRIDAQEPGYPSGEKVADAIWGSLRISPDQRVASAAIDAKASGSLAAYEPVTGGAGVHLRDNSLMRPAALGGLMAGALIGGLLFGALIAAGLIHLGARPLPALFVAQALLFGLATWGEAHDGVWTIDWLGRGVPELVAVALLRPWAQRKWQKHQVEASVTVKPVPATEKAKDGAVS